MDDLKLEARPGLDKKAEPKQRTGSYIDSLLPGAGTWISPNEGADVGACGDRLCELETRMAAVLSTDLLGVLNTPRRVVPDHESSKVACLKSAILDLQKENEALSWELWRMKRSQEEVRKRNDKEPAEATPQSVGLGIPNVPTPPPPDLKPSVQPNQAPDIPGRKTKPSSHREELPASVGKNAIPTSHSKCVAWLGHEKPVDERSDRFSLVRLALWQLWELADRVLTRKERSSGTSLSEVPEEVAEEYERSYSERPTCSRIAPSDSGELERLKSQLAHVQRSKEHFKRLRHEQALMLQQREMQVTRLQRSQTRLCRSFKAQLELLRKQQALGMKALQLKMQTEHASALANQNAAMEEQLNNAVEQLEKRYRNLLKDAVNGKQNAATPKQQLGSAPNRHSNEEPGT